MQYHVVSYYGELPRTLWINGSLCTCKHGGYGPLDITDFTLEGWYYNYVCYGTSPRTKELYEHRSWLEEPDREPFFVEIEKPVLEELEESKILYEQESEGSSEEETEVLPKKLNINKHDFARFFDRYYFKDKLTEKEIQFIFDYIAPTYEEDIDRNMNLDVNKKLIESIASFDLPSSHGQSEQVKILDYGVGTGICADAKPDVENDKYDNWRIVGLDISNEMVKEAQKRRRSQNPKSILLETRQIKNGISYPHLPDKSFDAAMACFTVQYFIDSQPYKEIYRLLKNGAPFVCNVLQNEIHKIEKNAKKAGLVPQGNCQQLEWTVKEQPVMLLAFKKLGAHDVGIISP